MRERESGKKVRRRCEGRGWIINETDATKHREKGQDRTVYHTTSDTNIKENNKEVIEKDKQTRGEGGRRGRSGGGRRL